MKQNNRGTIRSKIQTACPSQIEISCEPVLKEEPSLLNDTANSRPICGGRSRAKNFSRTDITK